MMKGTEAEIWEAFQDENVTNFESVVLHLPSRNCLVNGLSPISMAVILKDTDLISKLLESGADPNFENEDRSTALTLSRDIDTIKLLVQYRASARYETKYEDMTSLHFACREGDLEKVRILLESAEGHCCAETFDELGRTPLGVAAEYGNVAIVKLLIQHKFPVDACNATIAASTPLQLAIEEGHLDVIEVLVANGADIFLNYGLGQSPLKMASENVEVAKLLQPPRNQAPN